MPDFAGQVVPMESGQCAAGPQLSPVEDGAVYTIPLLVGMTLSDEQIAKELSVRILKMSAVNALENPLAE